jgi:hypothetical protein
VKFSAANERIAITLATVFLLLAVSPARAEPPHAQLRPFAPGGIAIDWEHPNDGASGITLERENPAFTWTFVALVNSFNDLGLQASNTYRYRVCAIYGQTPDCTSWLAAQTLATAPPPANPGVPTFTSSSATANSITVNWNSSSSYSFHNIRWAENGHGDGQQEVKGRTFTASSLRPGAYHFIVQGCNTTLLGSSCGSYSAPLYVSTSVPLPPPPPPVATLSKGVIYTVTLNDDLMWYRHDGRTDGSFRWAAGAGKQVGVGWNFKQLFASGGILYGIQDNGDLMWYQHLGREDGTFRWEGPKKVGNGWGAFTNVFSGGDGIIYAVEAVVGGLSAIYGQRPAPKTGGNLIWYRHVGQKDGSFRWEGPKKVGTGWSGLRQVFYGGDGIIYAIQENGDLMWCRHLGREDGTFRWEGMKKVGTGWGGFTKVFSGGDGVIYAVQDNGDLLWYRHDGRTDGSFRWAAAAGKKVGSGWYKFNLKQVFTD